MSSVPREALFRRKRRLLVQVTCTLKTLGKGDRLLTYQWASGGSAGQPPPGPDERALNQPKPHPSSKTV